MSLTGGGLILVLAHAIAEVGILVGMEGATPRRRWFNPTPNWVVVGSLVVTGFLYLSNWIGWWHTGYAVLSCVASVAAILGLLLLWFAFALVFHRQFQFSLRSLLVLVVAVALPFSWLAVEMRNAKTQGQAIELVRKNGGYIRSERERFADLPVSRTESPREPTWLRELLGSGFFDTPVICDFYGPETGDSALAPLEQLPELDWLSIGGSRHRFAPTVRTQVGDAGLEHVKRLPRLRNLFLERSRITDAGLVNLENLSELESVSLGDTRITDAGLKHLQGLRRLRSLYIGDTRTTGNGLEHLQGMTQLEELDLRNCPLDSENLKWIRQLPLHELNLGGCRNVADSGLQYLRSMSNLEHLSLEDTAITDAGLENLRGLTSLRWLLLRRTKVTDKGLECLRPLNRLECLGLDECAVTDAGLEYLRGFSHLKSLYLSKTKVTDAGLAQLRGLDQLWELTLGDCAITDAALDHVRTLAKLEYLHVRGTRVTERGVKKLKQALPGCNIDH
jgi:Leucine-rich repeat (LRR) protein